MSSDEGMRSDAIWKSRLTSAEPGSCGDFGDLALSERRRCSCGVGMAERRSLQLIERSAREQVCEGPTSSGD